MKIEFPSVVIVDIQYPFELIDAEQRPGPVTVEIQGDPSRVSLEQSGLFLVIKPQSSNQLAVGRNITQIGTAINSTINVPGNTGGTSESPKESQLPRLTLGYPEGVAVGRRNF